MTLEQIQELLQLDINDQANFTRLKLAVLDMKENPDGARPYESYVVTINQLVGAPTITNTFENTANITPTIAQAGTGVYTLASPAFLSGFVYVSLSSSSPGGHAAVMTNSNLGLPGTDYVVIQTYDAGTQLLSDGLLENAFLEIRIYPQP
jgi:hypothetical protein